MIRRISEMVEVTETMIGRNHFPEVVVAAEIARSLGGRGDTAQNLLQMMVATMIAIVTSIGLDGRPKTTVTIKAEPRVISMMKDLGPLRQTVIVTTDIPVIEVAEIGIGSAERTGTAIVTIARSLVTAPATSTTTTVSAKETEIGIGRRIGRRIGREIAKSAERIAIATEIIGIGVVAELHQNCRLLPSRC